MIELTASRILSALDGGDLESIRDDGVITVLIDLKPVLIIPEAPVPQVQTTAASAITIRSGEVIAATVQADDEADANEIASALAYVLSVARNSEG